jgi:hypothetical protein
MGSKQHDTEASYRDGRDELNLADFPISVLQRQQPLDERGDKLDSATYQASRYDREARQRTQQRVILETSSRHGLPTPADENVVLALLYIAKHTHNFAEPVVRFAPRQLFKIMGWAPNSRSYDRLRQVLRRLQALVIRYENSWWDVAGRGYEAEVATGIISEYELGRQVSGRKKGGRPPACWVCWSPRFQQSLSSGNLKKLDLERLFSLRLPTSQRMYRFLDKRFYPPHQPPPVEMDLHDFACGHIGLSHVDNVAELKRRLAPAIAELEAIGFIAKVELAERYQKVKTGVWRVRFRAGPQFLTRSRPDRRPPEPVEGGARGAETTQRNPTPVQPSAASPESASPAPRLSPTKEIGLVVDFYELWNPGERQQPGERDLEQARALVAHHGLAGARGLIPELVRIVRGSWPECKSFSGAAGKYGAEAARAYEQRLRSEERSQEAKGRREQHREEAAREANRQLRLEERWQALTEPERAEIEQQVLAGRPELRGRQGILKLLCLDRLGEVGVAEDSRLVPGS